MVKRKAQAKEPKWRKAVRKCSVSAPTYDKALEMACLDKFIKVIRLGDEVSWFGMEKTNELFPSSFDEENEMWHLDALQTADGEIVPLAIPKTMNYVPGANVPLGSKVKLYMVVDRNLRIDVANENCKEWDRALRAKGM